jgi:Tfp pilus assembly protein PilX
MIHNNKGIAMLLVISLILMLLILGGGVLMVSTGHFRGAYHQIDRERAYYAAEAAMQHTLWQLRTGAISAPYNGIFPNNINGINGNDIDIEVLTQNPQGVYPVNITVNY